MAGETTIIQGGTFINLALIIMLTPIFSSFILMFIRYLEIKKNKEIHGVPVYSALLGIGSLLVSFLFSVAMAIMYFTGEYGSDSEHLTTIVADAEMIVGTNFKFGLMIDPLSVLMTLLLGVIAFLIHLYAYEYMDHGEPEVTRFYAFLNFFTGSMFGFILSGNLFMSFIWWEMLGVSSYFLIGYYWKKDSARRAGTKAFLYNKVGDVAFMVAIFLILILPENTERTLDYHLLAELSIPAKELLLPGILLFGAAIGKSSQFPLFGWLPEAMEGPTPVSALLHSSTMVKAGLYLMIRNFAVLYDIHNFHATLPVVDPMAAATFVLFIGTVTAFMGASMATVSTDFKRILAFSTISQLGYIAMAIGAGGKTAAFYHLISHATFKSLLFLCAGSVIHGSGLTDIRTMGGLYRKMKYTMAATFFGLFGLSGFPFISSGFFSKDAVLLAVEKSSVPYAEVYYIVGVFTAFLTAFYSTRLFIEVFFGKTKDGMDKKFDTKNSNPHESGKYILTALISLSVLVILESLMWAISTYGGITFFLTEEWLAEMLGVHGHAFEWSGAFTSFGVVTLGYLLGLYLYQWNPSARDLLKKPLGWMGTIAENRFGIDILINWISMGIVVKYISPAFAAVDEKVIDEYLINTVISQQIGLGSAELADTIDQDYIDGAVNATWRSTRYIGRVFRKLQTGLTGNYAQYMAVGLVLLLALVTVLNEFGLANLY